VSPHGKGRSTSGAFDGRLVALDAKTGKPAWSVVTGDQKNLTITGAPRVVKGRVIIGMSGGEYGIRGYISAYDAETGKLAWRFYTVPGDPSKPFENKAMEMAAKTWSGEWWKLGGGGTTWDAISYDPISISSTSEPATASNGRATTAPRARATTCSRPRSSRSTPTPANTSGTTRPHPARSGTSTPCSS
jgi:hypothetical protein